MLMILQSMSEFNGVWKHQNNPACTTGISHHNVEVGHDSMDYGNTKTTPHALPVSVIVMLKLDTLMDYGNAKITQHALKFQSS